MKKIVLPGGAGLVGQNLIARLVVKGYTNIVVLDKHRANIKVLQRLHPDITVEYADVSKPGHWQSHLINADVVVMLQAQIGGNNYLEFVRNNVESTRIILETIKENSVAQLIHISSSVVESISNDFYTNTKKDQETLVLESGISCPILRPTLMFGWFDRKHLGWLARFMQRTPVFPIPGHGRYMRQPLYVGDFSKVIISCIEKEINDGVYNISGHEQIDYIDIIRKIKQVTKSKTPILKIPYFLFFGLIWLWGLFDKNPPFTTQQLVALTARDEFEVNNWPEIFDVPYTSFTDALNETFNDPRYSHIILEF